MGKTVYSVVLSQEVIEAIDSLAVQQGLSRSGLINHVLAEYSGLSTPERRMRELAALVQRQALGGGLRADISSSGGLTLYTSLRFKYNPSLRYQLDFSESGPTLAELRVGLRSQNEELLSYLATFFELWRRLEQKHLPQPPAAAVFSQERGRFRRALRRPAAGAGDEQQLGLAVADYLTGMDGCLKEFFSQLNNPSAAVRSTEQYFLDFLEGHAFASRL